MQATITSKGQVTLPKAIRDQLGLTEGTRLDFEIVDGAIRVRPLNNSLDKVIGILHRPGQQPVSAEEMDKAIEQAAVDRYRGASRSGEDDA